MRERMQRRLDPKKQLTRQAFTPRLASQGFTGSSTRRGREKQKACFRSIRADYCADYTICADCSICADYSADYTMCADYTPRTQQ
ncbi:hypothetical protein NDU88_008497 [Pleurodeles waltl]|uniref:Uncharacterized protein n=1 Tax=Pleurodeles waltl TaxID=8319 RepID=A0AAV7N8L7_PLEWA|nr:hypothetical protein NDU88_008497 [Pleurodeles waltl]